MNRIGDEYRRADPSERLNLFLQFRDHRRDFLEIEKDDFRRRSSMHGGSFFARQARKPSGWFGRWIMAGIFDIGNAPLNRFVLDTLSPEPGDRILEIGCGTGKLLRSIVRKTESCEVEGIDFSGAMVAVARKNNRKYIAKRKVSINESHFEAMPLPRETFTKVCSVNTIYFWSEPGSMVRKVASLLARGGMLVLGYEDIAQLRRRRLDPKIFRLYSSSEVEALLSENGIAHDVLARSIRNGTSIFHCTIAFR